MAVDEIKRWIQMHYSSKWSSWCLCKSNNALVLKMSPFQNKLFCGKKWKVFWNQSIIAWDFKSTSLVRCSDWCGINGGMHLVHSRRNGGWINNKQISRNCKRYWLINKPFFSKVAKRALWQKMLTELSEKLWTQFSRDLMDVSGQKRKLYIINDHCCHIK